MQYLTTLCTYISATICMYVYMYMYVCTYIRTFSYLRTYSICIFSYMEFKSSAMSAGFLLFQFQKLGSGSHKLYVNYINMQ